jgi:hypothetical protein
MSYRTPPWRVVFFPLPSFGIAGLYYFDIQDFPTVVLAVVVSFYVQLQLLHPMIQIQIQFFF